MDDWVLVDTCVWAPFLNNPQLRHDSPLAQLLEDDQVAMVGPILQEILIGIRRKEQADWIASQLEGVNWIHLQREDWINAAHLGRELAKDAKRLPAADLQIAAVALRTGCKVYSTDPHFDSFPDLSRYEPED